MAGEQEPRSSIAWRVAVIVAAVATACSTVALVAIVTRYEAYTFPSESMSNTIVPGDRLLAAHVDGDDVRRGDIVVFRSDVAWFKEIDRVARVVALGGDSLDVSDGSVRIDGRLLDESYLADGTVTERLSPITVPDGTLFLMGDNRESSRDSRNDGPVPTTQIRARVDYIGNLPLKWVVFGLWILSAASLTVLMVWPVLRRRRRARDLQSAVDGATFTG